MEENVSVAVGADVSLKLSRPRAEHREGVWGGRPAGTVRAQEGAVVERELHGSTVTIPRDCRPRLEEMECTHGINGDVL
jgi:hypothetical protein